MILIDGFIVKFGKFPNNESHLNHNIISYSIDSVITFKFESDQDLFNLFILKSYLDSKLPVNNRLKLEILYMPYSRMDRDNNHYTFNLKYVCNFINNMKFSIVIVMDAHSDVTLALLDRCIEKSNIGSLFLNLRKEYNDINFVMLYPDSGAQKRYSKVFNYPTVVGSKERDFKTGTITKFSIQGDVIGKDVIIIDDLCSKGGTFMGAAIALKEAGALRIFLIVAHCENTIFEGDIFKSGLFEKVYTTDSILTGAPIGAEKMHITNLSEVKTDGY